MKTRSLACAALMVCAIFLLSAYARAAGFRIVIMQDDKGAAEKYRPLLTYLQKKGVDVSLVGAPNYTTAAKMFAAGEADAMFSGSGVAGTLIIKGLAVPSVRPESAEGYSTYWADIIAPKGSAKFTGSAGYFSGKKVILTALASSGEFYYYSIPKIRDVNAHVMIAASHGAALDVLARGVADVAIVKDRIWDKKAGEYPGLEKVGEDKGENPDSTLMVSTKADPKTSGEISAALLSIKGDTSAEARAAKEKLGIQGFIKTTKADFRHTLPLLKRAGVTKSFDFKY